MKTIEEYTPDARTLANCLISEYQWLLLLINKKKPYQFLLKYLIELGKEENANPDDYQREKRQSNKMAEVIGVRPSNIKKWLIEIYEDILDLNYNSPQLFNINNYSFLYRFSFSAYSYNYYGLNLWIPNIMSRFDSVELFFIRAKMNQHHFWIKEITHEYSNGHLISLVQLEGGYYNSYRELLLDKAGFLHDISLSERYNSHLYTIDEKLRQYARQEKL